MQFPRNGPPSNELNDLHVLDSHVGPDFADGVDLGSFANVDDLSRAVDRPALMHADANSEKKRKLQIKAGLRIMGNRMCQ
jgi:hypothetical protein